MQNYRALLLLAALNVLNGCSEARTSTAAGTGAAEPVPQASTGVKAPTGSAPSTCPADNFSSFLQAFASDERIRDRFTAPAVAVTDWRNVDEPSEGAEITNVPKADYRGFTLHFRDGALHNVSADGTVDSHAEDVKVARRGNDYLVSYVYGMSEGNSWRFAAKDGCWVLVADPEPSSL